ncbi:hypothetical protein BDF22DRAFT_774814 [Syncephalis plumigaleata]|nr:hypothetical protein BDF22DRAFT_774814 [Syncephalis plumigaleata]
MSICNNSSFYLFPSFISSIFTMNMRIRKHKHIALSRWSWIASDTVTMPIANDHMLTAYRLSCNLVSSCHSKQLGNFSTTSNTGTGTTMSNNNNNNNSLASRRGHAKCQFSRCRTNPFCLNYLSQDVWSKTDAFKRFKLAKGHDMDDPREIVKVAGLPAGLRNLGATCYMNALLQVLYYDRVFRQGIYDYIALENDIQDELNMHDACVELQKLFARLQLGRYRYYDPSYLVRLLGLNTGEQQDAQEFCKLLLMMLSNSFANQPREHVRGLIHRRFSGQYVYGTQCQHCKRLSTRQEPFYELELSLKEDDRLEECIQRLLVSETLTGDNQYYCDACKQKQDATRTLSIQSLPPVLHLQLMRFVFNASTFEREKTGACIQFPATLDMAPFTNDSTDECMQYDLTAVLLHDGKQANCGHFIAHVYNASNDQKWYQFNDEHVELLEGTITHDIKAGNHARKRFKRVKKSFPTKTNNHDNDKVFTSRNAYMLIYTRRDTHTSPCQVPEWLMNNLNQEEASLQTQLNQFDQMESEDRSLFERACQERHDMIERWRVDQPSDIGYFLPTALLKQWMTGPLHHVDKEDDTHAMSSTEEEQSVSPEDLYKSLACSHGKLTLDYTKTAKVVNKDVGMFFINFYHLSSLPTWTIDSLCMECVYKEASILHTQKQRDDGRKHVELAMKCASSSGGFGCISKRWWHDWCTLNGEALVNFCSVFERKSDNTDVTIINNYYHDLYCEHNVVRDSSAHKWILPNTAIQHLTQLYPLLPIIDTGTERLTLCTFCTEENIDQNGTTMTLLNQSLPFPDVEERRQRERGWPKEFAHHDVILSDLLNGNRYYIVSTDFIKQWQKFIRTSAPGPKPYLLDNSPLVCQHERFPFDAVDVLSKPQHASTPFRFVSQTLWWHFSIHYSPTHELWLECSQYDDNNDNGKDNIICNIGICKDCILARMMDYKETTISIIKRNSDTTSITDTPIKLNTGKRLRSKTVISSKDRPLIPRLRISKMFTLLDIKLAITNRLGISPICQRLYRNDEELTDNTMTVTDLQLLPGTLLALEELEEDEQCLLNDTTTTSTSSTSTYLERGFSGTALSKFS